MIACAPNALTSTMPTIAWRVADFMKRDMDLVRAIALAIADAESGFAPKLEIRGPADERIRRSGWQVRRGAGFSVNDLKERGLQYDNLVAVRPPTEGRQKSPGCRVLSTTTTSWFH